MSAALEIEHSDNVTVEMVEDGVEEVRNLRGDDELAHETEYALHLAVLQAIADGRIAIGTSTPDVARAAAGTADIEFKRWRA